MGIRADGEKVGGKGVSGKKWWKVSCLVIFMLFSLVFLTLYLFVWRVPDNSREFISIRKQAEGELDVLSAIPENANGYLLYKEAVEELKKTIDPESGEMDDWGAKAVSSGEVSVKDLPELKRFKQLNSRTLQLVEEGYKKPYCFFPYDYRKGLEAPVPDRFGLRNLSTFLSIAGQGEALEGRYAEAFRHYFEILRLFYGVKETANLDYTRYSNEICLITWEFMQKLMPELSKDATLSYSVLSEMKELRKRRKLILHNFYIEYLIADQFLSLVDSPSGGIYREEVVPVMRVLFKRERKIYQNWFLSAMKILSKSYREAEPGLRDMKDSSVSVYAESLIRNSSVSSVYRIFVHEEVVFGGMLLLAGLEQYRNDMGVYPDQLEVLVPDYLDELPTDPYAVDGKYVYRKEGSSFRLYSIGPDLKDDGGGVGIRYGNRLESGDLVFR